MNTTQKPPSLIPWAPLATIAALASGIALAAFYPLPWAPRPVSDMIHILGYLFIAAAFALYLTSVNALRRAKTTILPVKATEQLVTTGPYGLSRNPIYLGNLMLTFGIGFATGNAWMLPLALMAAFVTSKLAITGEERHLAHRFGKKYRDYAKKVRRWI